MLQEDSVTQSAQGYTPPSPERANLKYIPNALYSKPHRSAEQPYNLATT